MELSDRSAIREVGNRCTVAGVGAAVAEAGGPRTDRGLMSLDLESARRRCHRDARRRRWDTVVGGGSRRRRRGIVVGLLLGGIHDEDKQGKGRTRVVLCLPLNCKVNALGQEPRGGQKKQEIFD